MTARLSHICRHPIKSIGWEMLDSVELSVGKVVPWDRHWALAHEAAGFDPAAPGWRPKRDFVRGVASAPLMAVRAEFSEENATVTLSHPDLPPITIAPDTAAGSEELVKWISPLWPATRPAAAKIVTSGADQALTDVEPPFISVLSLSSLRDFSARMGADLSIHRWRGNLWLDGLQPWEEFDWIGQDIEIGPVTLRVEERITRCRATEANPETGRADVDTLMGLEKFYGHQDFGIYARVKTEGTVAHGDPFALA